MARDPEGDRNITGHADIFGGLRVHDYGPDDPGGFEGTLEVVGSEDQLHPYVQVRDSFGNTLVEVTLEGYLQMPYLIQVVHSTNDLNFIEFYDDLSNLVFAIGPTGLMSGTGPAANNRVKNLYQWEHYA